MSNRRKPRNTGTAGDTFAADQQAAATEANRHALARTTSERIQDIDSDEELAQDPLAAWLTGAYAFVYGRGKITNCHHHDPASPLLQTWSTTLPTFAWCTRCSELGVNFQLRRLGAWPPQCAKCGNAQAPNTLRVAYKHVTLLGHFCNDCWTPGAPDGGDAA